MLCKQVLVRAGVTAFILALSVGTASALTHHEAGDAGELLATGQAVTAGTTVISGNLSQGNDADLFRFSWSGGGLTFDTNPASIDTMLTLVDSTGTILAFNDDSPECCGSQLFTALGAGNYGIAVSSYPNAPNSWAVSGPLVGWGGNGVYSGHYDINLSAAVGSPVPEPSTFALLLAGLAILGFTARRRTAQGV